MEGWTRDQAIADVMFASDGFGRTYGPDLEMPPQLEDFQPCVVEMARHIVHCKMRRAKGHAPPPVAARCARPGCSTIFAMRKNKRFCSTTCALRETRRKYAAARRKRRRG